MPSKYKDPASDKLSASSPSGYQEDDGYGALELAGDLASRVLKKGSGVVDFFTSPSSTAMDEPVYDERNRQIVTEPALRKRNFDRWFEGSKVVGENGNPLVLYHSGDFNEELDPVFADSLQGIHFGSKAAAFDRYMMKPTEDFINSAELRYDDDEGGWVWDSMGESSFEAFGSEEQARKDLEAVAEQYAQNVGESLDDADFDRDTTKVYLSIKNPKYTSDAGGDWSKIIEKAKKQGHDGIIYTNKYEDPGSKSYIIFDSRQAKSVNNKGGYDPDNPDILSFNSLEDQDAISANEGGLMSSEEMGGHGNCGCPACQLKKMMSYVQDDMSSLFAPLTGMGMGAVGFDPISGNQIPAGSGPDNVRDDIPAVLSDGEYVVPADVVRYHGLKYLEQLRQEAKMGLMSMMAEGQIQTIEEEEEAYNQSAEPMDEEEYEEEVTEEDAEEGEGYETPEGVEVEQPEVKTIAHGMMMFRPSQKLAFMRA